MKKIFSFLVLAAVAATALVSCQQDIQGTIEPAAKGVNSFKFYAQSTDALTKATLTPNSDETAFAAAWTGGDAMELSTYGYIQGTDTEFNATGTATWDADDEAFTADYGEGVTVPTEAYTKWTYNAFFPAKEGSFGSARKQNGNAYNSAYDLMYGNLETSGCVIGKDSEGAPIVIPMNRLTAIAYYHIEDSDAPDEPLVSATLTVDEGKIIAADCVRISDDGTMIYTTDSENNETGTNSITITFDGDSAPSAQDFTLWYNLLVIAPNDYVIDGSSASPGNTDSPAQYNVTLDIETAGHTARLTSKSARSFTAGRLNRAHIISGLTWTAKPLFKETFSGCNGTGGNDGKWNGSIASTTFTDGTSSDNSGWVLVSGNAAKECIKLGTASKQGSATTPAFNVTSDLATLTFKAAAWNVDNETTTLNVSIAEGTGVLSASSVTLEKGAWTPYTIYIAGAGSGTKIKFEAAEASNNRFFLDEVKVVPGGTEFDYLSVSTTGEELDADATEASFTITTNGDWTASVAEADASLSAASGSGNETLTVTFPANSTGSAVTAATVTITVGSGDDAIVKTVTYTQKPNENAIVSKTIAEFIELADTETNYRLTGTVSSAINTTYNRFTLTDATGSVTVFRLDDVSNFVEGDIVTIHGKYELYNETTHEVVDGVYESHVTTPKLDVSTSTISALADATSATFNVVASDATAWTVSSNNADLSFNPSSGTGPAEITVSFSSNNESTAKTATITVSSTTENVYKSPREIEFAQDGRITGKPSTFTLNGTFTASGTESLTLTQNRVTLLLSKGTSSNFYTSGTTTSSMRIYNGNTLKISSEDYYITEVVFTYTSSYTGATMSATSGTVTHDSTNKTETWSGQSQDFTISFGSQLRPAGGIVITYLDPNATVEDPTLTVDEDFELVVGQTKTLTVSTNSDGTKSYSSSNPSVATVENGVVTAVAAGSATITVNVAAAEWYNAASKTVDVTVVAKALSSIAVSGQTRTFATGSSFSFDGTVTATYNDATTAPVTPASVTVYEAGTTNIVTGALAEGTYDVVVSYAEDDVTKTATYQIQVTDEGGGTSWQEVTAVADVTEGEYVIAWVPTGNNVSTYYYLPSGTTYTNNPVAGSGITVSDGKITSEVSSSMIWTFSGDNTNGYTISDGTNILCSTNAAQGISIATSGTTKWTLSLSSNTTYTGLLLHGNDAGSRYLALYYNTTTPASSTWRYYSSFGNGNYYGILHLFKKTTN